MPYRPNWRNNSRPDQRQVKAYHGTEDNPEDGDNHPDNTPHEDVKALHYGQDNRDRPETDSWEREANNPSEEDVIESDAHYVDTTQSVQCRRCKA